MPTNLQPPPHRVPVIDQGTGRMSQQWSDFFQRVFLRIGGGTSYTNDELYPVDSARITTSVAGNGLAGGAGTPLSVGVDGSTIEIATDLLQVKDSGIPFIKLLSTNWTSNNAATGYQKLGSGIYIQWGVSGSVGSGTSSTLTFATAFPTACRQVIAGIQGNSGGVTTATGQWGTGNYTTSGFDLFNRTSAAYTFNYMAVGY